MPPPYPLVLREVESDPVAPELAPLLHAAYDAIVPVPADLPTIKGALSALLHFLASPAGRTSANCTAADAFFMHLDRWTGDWEHLPEGYQDVLGDLGGALHDTVQTPAVAANFDSTPEQLLARVAALDDHGAAG